MESRMYSETSLSVWSCIPAVLKFVLVTTVTKSNSGKIATLFPPFPCIRQAARFFPHELLDFGTQCRLILHGPVRKLGPLKVIIDQWVVPETNLRYVAEYSSDFVLGAGISSHLDQPSESSVVCSEDDDSRQPLRQNSSDSRSDALFLVEGQSVPVDVFNYVPIFRL